MSPGTSALESDLKGSQVTQAKLRFTANSTALTQAARSGEWIA
jgi:hypothetical protein